MQSQDTRDVGMLRAIAAIVIKDLRIEARSGDVVVTTSLFAVMVTVVASFSFFIDQATSVRIAPGVMWVGIVFSSILAMGRSWGRERDRDVMRGLLIAPIPRPAIFLGKAISSLIFMLLVELILVPLVVALFNLDIWPVAGRIALIIFLGTIGFVAGGTLFSVLTVRSSARDLMLSVVVLPLVSPALLSAVAATRDTLLGATWDQTTGWFQLLLAFDITFIVAGVVLFEPMTTE